MRNKHQLKYKVIRFILLDKILNSFKNKTFIHIQEDFELRKNFIISLYVEDLKNKIIYGYSIKQSKNDLEKDTKEFEEINKQLVNFDFIKEQKYIVIPINNAPNDLEELSDWLDKYIFH